VKTLSDILGGVTEVWDDHPGGKIIREYTEDGIKYVVVVFKGDPEQREYTYFKADN
jgi:hypothetical protein